MGFGVCRQVKAAVLNLIRQLQNTKKLEKCHNTVTAEFFFFCK